MNIPTDKILPNPDQSRTEFDEDELITLANSIKQHGLINPIAVEEAGEHYILIDGERRWRAAKIAGLSEIEASVRPSSNGRGSENRLIWAIVANIQRRDMNPVEEARAFMKLKTSGKTGDQIARMAGISPSLVSSRLLILDLAPEIQEIVAARKLPLDRAFLAALLDINDEAVRMRLARRLSGASMNAKAMTTMARRIAGGMAMPNGNHRKATEKEGKWNMLVIVEDAPGSLRPAALDTCKACILYDDASSATCRECPAVDLLRRLVKAGVK